MGLNGASNQSMWDSQKDFYTALKDFADKVFNALLPNLFNQIYLVGTNESCPDDIFIEQEDGEFKSEDFSISNGTFEKIKQLIYSDITEKNGKTVLRKKIEDYNTQNDKQKRRVSFVSEALQIEKYYFFLVLQLNKDIFLDSDYFRDFLNTLIKVFFITVSKEFKWKESGESLQEVSEKDLLKLAGKDFMNSLLEKIDCDKSGMNKSLAECLNNISKTKYESTEAKGIIIFCRQQQPNIKVEASFYGQHIEITNARLVRKLLELTDSDTGLLCDGFYVFGIGKITGKDSSALKNLFIIEFDGYGEWKLFESFQNDKPFLRYKDDNPLISTANLDGVEFKRCAKQAMCGNINDVQANAMYSCVVKFIEQRKGAVIVFASEPDVAVKKLGKQVICINPDDCAVDAVQRFSSIDGAVFMDKDCKCHAIGAILDGLADENIGDPARGSRYNSSFRYYEAKKDKMQLFIVVISEDGMVNIIPEYSEKTINSFLYEENK